MSKSKKKDPPLTLSSVCGCGGIILAIALAAATNIPKHIVSRGCSEVASGIKEDWADKGWCGFLKGIPKSALNGFASGVLLGLGDGVIDFAEMSTEIFNGNTKMLAKVLAQDALVIGSAGSGYFLYKGYVDGQVPQAATALSGVTAFLCSHSVSSDIEEAQNKKKDAERSIA